MLCLRSGKLHLFCLQRFWMTRGLHWAWSAKLSLTQLFPSWCLAQTGALRAAMVGQGTAGLLWSCLNRRSSGHMLPVHCCSGAKCCPHPSHHAAHAADNTNEKLPRASPSLPFWTNRSVLKLRLCAAKSPRLCNVWQWNLLRAPF